MTIYNILVTVIGLSLLIFSVVFPKVLSNGRESMYRCLTGDIDKYGVVLVDDKTFLDIDAGRRIYDNRDNQQCGEAGFPFKEMGCQEEIQKCPF